jgi:hypothetical protein
MLVEHSTLVVQVGLEGTCERNQCGQGASLESRL